MESNVSAQTVVEFVEAVIGDLTAESTDDEIVHQCPPKYPQSSPFTMEEYIEIPVKQLLPQTRVQKTRNYEVGTIRRFMEGFTMFGRRISPTCFETEGSGLRLHIKIPWFSFLSSPVLDV